MQTETTRVTEKKSEPAADAAKSTDAATDAASNDPPAARGLQRHLQKLRPEVQSMLIFSLAGIAIGLFAGVLSTSQMFFVGIVAVAVLAKVLGNMLYKNKDWKWFVGNAVWPFLATWYATWVIVINL